MVIKNVALLVITFSVASSWLYFLYYLSGPDARLRLPRDLESLSKLRGVLEEYVEQRIFYTVVFFSSVYLYKQAFAIPGSVFMNLLSGALFGVTIGFPLVSILSGCGASCCYIISKMCGRQILIRYAPHRITYFQNMVEKSREEQGLFKFLLGIRVFPMSPNWLINICCPIVGVPLRMFFLSVLVGLAPYNFITCNAGAALAELKSLDDVMSFKMAIVLGLLAIGILNPLKFVKRLKAWNQS